MNKALVVRALNEKRETLQGREFHSKHDKDFVYRVGEWVLMKAIESDLEGKEIVIDLRSQKKSQAKGMSKEDVLKAFWVSELRRSQVEHVLGMVRENVQWDPYMNYEGEEK